MDNLMLGITACVFCFITGMFTAHMIEQGRGCKIEMTRGQVTIITTGERDD